MLKLRCVFLLTLVAALGAYHCSADELSLKLTAPDLLEKCLRASLVNQKEREGAIQALFSEAGCTATLQPVQKNVDNVICTLPGETQSSRRPL